MRRTEANSVNSLTVIKGPRRVVTTMSTPTQSDADETFGIPTLLGLLSDLKSSVVAVNQAAKAVEKSVNKKIKQLKRA